MLFPHFWVKGKKTQPFVLKNSLNNVQSVCLVMCPILIPAVFTSIAAERNSNWLRNVGSIMYWAGTYYAGCWVMGFRCFKLLSLNWRLLSESGREGWEAAGWRCHPAFFVCWASLNSRKAVQLSCGLNAGTRSVRILFLTHKSATVKKGDGGILIFSWLFFYL